MIKLSLLPPDLEAYIRELTKVAVVLSDNYLKEAYPLGEGYIDTVDAIHLWAVEFMERIYPLYADGDWEDFCYSDTNPYNGRTDCWDDLVIAFGDEKIGNDIPHFPRPIKAMYTDEQGIAIAKEIIAGKTVQLDYRDYVGDTSPLYFAIRNTPTRGKALLCNKTSAVPVDSEPVIANFTQGLEEPEMMWALGIKDRLTAKRLKIKM